MQNKNLPVVFSTDDNYVLPLCVTMQSILKTKKPDEIGRAHV